MYRSDAESNEVWVRMQTDKELVMRPGRRAAWLVPALALLAAACASYPDVAEVDTLKQRDSGKPFFGELLALQYEQLAITEADYRGNVEAARFYADKGILAAQGQAVAPESPTSAPEVQEAHLQLISFLDEEMALIAPAMLARAQTSYDCWVEESRQGDSEDNLAACRNDFSQAVAALAAQQPPQPLSELTPDYTLFFATASMRLTDDDEVIVRQIAGAVQTGDVRGIRIAGFSDRAGNAESNFRLSELRARSVFDALSEAGVPRELMSTEAFGEMDPLIETADGVSEARNRRVEVYLVR